MWCESQALCFASGTLSSAGNKRPQLLQSADPAGGHWSVASTFWLDGVSCPTASLCFAVGASPGDGTVGNQVGGTVVVGTADAVKPTTVQPPKLYHKESQVASNRQVTGALILSCESGTWSGTTPLTIRDEILQDGSVLRSSVLPSPASYVVRGAYRGHRFACREVATNSAGSVAVMSPVFVPGGSAKGGEPRAPSVAVSCKRGGAPCAVTVTMVLGRTTVGKLRLGLPAAHQRRIKLTLNRTGRRLLRTRHKLAVTVVITIAQRHHHPSTVTDKRVFTA
jgi:hypothetical protein